MNHRSISSAFLCLAVAISYTAVAMSARGQFTAAQPYAEAVAGVQILDSSAASSRGLPDLKVEFEPGYRAEGHFGYLFRNGAEIANREQAFKLDIAVEFETGLSQNEISTIGIDLSRERRTFDFLQVPLLANVILRFPVGEQFHVDIGGGGGAVMKFISATHPNGDSTGVGVGWDAFLKAGYDVTPHFSVGAFSKFIGVGATDLPSNTRVQAGPFTLHPKRIEDTIGLVFGAYVAWIF